MVEIIEALYGHTVSEAAIVEACAQTALQVASINQTAKEELKVTGEAVRFDETGGQIAKKLWWLHVVCTNLLTCLDALEMCCNKELDHILSSIEFRRQYFRVNTMNFDEIMMDRIFTPYRIFWNNIG